LHSKTEYVKSVSNLFIIIPKRFIHLQSLTKEHCTIDKDKWNPAHRPTNYDLWYSTDEMYPIEYAEGYEPYIIGDVASMPLYVSTTGTVVAEMLMFFLDGMKGLLAMGTTKFHILVNFILLATSLLVFLISLSFIGIMVCRSGETKEIMYAPLLC
jgi:hypothetical protein